MVAAKTTDDDGTKFVDYFTVSYVNENDKFPTEEELLDLVNTTNSCDSCKIYQLILLNNAWYFKMNTCVFVTQSDSYVDTYRVKDEETKKLKIVKKMEIVEKWSIIENSKISRLSLKT